jgi:alpha-L-rhamnosidase
MVSQKVKKGNYDSVKAPTSLLCEYIANPLGIDVTLPRFSWVLTHLGRGQLQSAYQVLVARKREYLDTDNGDMWDSGKATSGKSVNVPYAGTLLESRKMYYWKVRVWDKDGKVSPWSKTATFEMGLLKPDDWEGKWIKGGNLLRKEFTVGKDIEQARAYICGLGYYELRINGEKVGDHVLDPGWTDYEKRALYVTYDLINYLKGNENAVGVMLGNGRYSPPDKVSNKNLTPPLKKYGHSPVLILQIHIHFTDGSSIRVVTDETWKTVQGPIVRDDIYDGETYDARLEREGWDAPNFDDANWNSATVVDAPGGKLISQASFPPIKVVKILQPKKITNPKSNVYVYDFAQNFTGWVRLRVRGPRSTQVQLRYAELLDENGMTNTIPNRGAKATDTYILKGEGEEIYEPCFTYHGFRYVEITGFPGTPTLESLEGGVVHSAVEPVGGFTCSNSLINKIHQNVLWGQLSNLMSIPTDCPQRDERMGWMGDAQLVVEEAIYNFDMVGFFGKWTGDIEDAQKEDGSVPDVVPPYWSIYPADPAWGTACVTIPWHLYLYYEDKHILEQNYSLMKKWVDFLGAQATDYIITYGKYGDWCPPGHIKTVDTPGELTSTWYYFHDVMVLSKIARILGSHEDAEKYVQLSDKIKEAFNKKFLKDDHYGTGSQTCNILPLFLDMVPEDRKKTVLKNLIDDIVITHSNHLNTGIVGTRYILDVLTQCGQANLAYKLVTQTTYPGWGYMIREGATTLWERWEYLIDAGMNSHNHIMFGSVDTWFYKVLAGINSDPAGPGFRRIIIRPHVVGDLNHVSASINTIRGMISSSWKKNGHWLTLDITLPVNTQAKVSVPKIKLSNLTIKESGKTIWENDSYLGGIAGITGGSQNDERVTFDVGSGSYFFEASGRK